MTMTWILSTTSSRSCSCSSWTRPTSRFPISRQRLCKLGLGPNSRAVPIEDIDRNSDAETDDGENGAGPREGKAAREDFVKRGGVHGGHAGEEVTGHAVAACGGGRVRTVGGDHVVDGGHVDAEIGDANDSRKDHGCDPGNAVAWAQGGPCEAD